MKYNRRHFLKQSIATSSLGLLSTQIPPVSQFLKLISDNIFNKANASNYGKSPNYIAFHLSGAPARWCFDQFLKTQNSQNIISNLGVATHLIGDNNSYANAAYSTIDIDSLPLPPLWNTTVNSSIGNQRSLRELLPHLISFRGYGTGVDGHAANSSRQTNPTPGIGSTTGHVADRSNKLFRAFQFPNLDSFSGYNSVQSTGLNILSANNTSNLFNQLLSPFTQRNDTLPLQFIKVKYGNEINEFYKQIRFAKSQKFSGLSPLSLDFDNSIKTINEGISDLEQTWPSLYSKYEKIIIDTLRDKTTKGFSDLPIYCPNSALSNMDVNGKLVRPNTSFDLRACYNTANCFNLISSFALAEFVITRGYCSAMEFGKLQPTNLMGYFNGETDPIQFSLEFDQHNFGVIPMTYFNSMFFRAFGAGLLEFIDQLKKINVFDNSFIHLVQEFGRTPRNDGSGSDHAFDGMITSIFTGANTLKPIVVGNISKGESPDSFNITGTYGNRALTEVNGKLQLLTPAHVTSSLASLMKLDFNPWANVAPPLLNYSGDALISTTSGEIV